MKKEPLFLYLLRFVFSLGLFACMGMLYWSSLLIEGDMRQIQDDLGNLKKEVSSLQSLKFNPNTSQTKTSALNIPLSEQMKNRPHIDPKLPNLLEEDPFYVKTLPELLGENFYIHGTFQSAAYAKPKNLQPFSGLAQEEGWSRSCNVTVANNKFGIYDTLSPDMAIKMEERVGEDGSPEYWIHLRDGVYWTPLRQELFTNDVKIAPIFSEMHKVTAHDFKFNLDVIKNPFVQLAGAIATRVYIDDIEELKVIDDLTFSVRWKTKEITLPDGKKVKRIKYIAKSWTGALSPLPRFVFQYFADGKKIIEDDSDPNTYRTSSVWAQNFMRHFAFTVIVGCGRWNFDGMTERQLKFARNSAFYDPLATLAEASIISFKENPDSIWQDFKANKIDSIDLRPNQISELEQFLQSDSYKTQEKEGYAVKRLDYLSRIFTYVGWNEIRPFFQSAKVRRALTMAINRERIVDSILNGMGVVVTGPSFIKSKSYDQSIKSWPYDPLAAKRLMEEEGWFDSTGSGIIDKEIDGKKVPFRFTLTYYVKNPTSEAICSYISTALKEVGIDCHLNGLDIADLTNSIDDKSFDALLLAWVQGAPPEEPRQIWHSSSAKEKGSSNTIGFSNPEVDRIIELLDFEFNPEVRQKLYHQFHRILHEEQPYTFLYTPKTAFLYRETLQNVFIPAERQDLVPGADVESPQPQIFWLKKVM